MECSTRPVRTLALVMVAALLSACAPKDEAPARKAIDQISAAIESAGPDATKYVPRHVAALEGQVTKLKVRFYDEDYEAIVADAPAILERAEALASTAAAKKAEIAQVLDGEWSKLVTDVPAVIESAGEIRGRSHRFEEDRARHHAGDGRVRQDRHRRAEVALGKGDSSQGRRRPRTGSHDRRARKAQTRKSRRRTRRRRGLSPTSRYGPEQHHGSKSRRIAEEILPQARPARPVRRPQPALARRSRWCRTPSARMVDDEGAADHPRALREPHVPAGAGRRTRRARPARQLARGLRLRGHERASATA